MGNQFDCIAEYTGESGKSTLYRMKKNFKTKTIDRLKSILKLYKNFN